MKSSPTIQAVAIALFVVLSPLAFAGDPPATKPFRIGTCDWSIKMPLSADSFYFAKETRLMGIQYSFGKPGVGLDLRTRENRDTIREVVRTTDVAIASLGIGILNQIPLATTEEAEQLVSDCMDAMIKMNEEASQLTDRELAAKVSPKIVLLAFFGKADINGNPERMEAVIKTLKRLAPVAEEHGLILGLETLLDETDLRYIIESVGSPAVKVYYDTGNSARMGYDIYAEIQSLGCESICEVHIKENDELLGDGTIDFSRIKSLLRAMQYPGWLIIEGSAPKKTSRTEATQKNAAYALGLFHP
ncbi:Inosose dehydratase [Rubripirellula tenax]|uniref:Inosose dehydratase n=1 Tax=Rubripirellula tenax TaxID=2528015 RepID=A0A5C6E4P5_9BACT|nr:sugar phosphate isomerase/epimerase family protein [Rubripirellula tenax]TWU43645.1 Inosose dehydratase [Rubripirellula tenax]